MKNSSYKLKTISAILALTFLYSTEGNANKVRIINHSKNNIEVRLIPEPAETCKELCWSCLAGTVKSNTTMVRTINLSEKKLKTGQLFSVRGTEGGLMSTGECRNLNVQNDYEISFFETDLGVRCESKSI